MKLFLVLFAFVSLSLPAFADLDTGLGAYAKRVSVTRPVDNDRNREPYAEIRIVKVHPNVSIHYFKKDKDPYMFLNHAVDSRGVMYFNAVLFPLIGMKTYVNDVVTSGQVKPYSSLDADSKEILDLTLEQIEQFGGVEEYVKFLEMRG